MIRSASYMMIPIGSGPSGDGCSFPSRSTTRVLTSFHTPVRLSIGRLPSRKELRNARDARRLTGRGPSQKAPLLSLLRIDRAWMLFVASLAFAHRLLGVGLPLAWIRVCSTSFYSEFGHKA